MIRTVLFILTLMISIGLSGSRAFAEDTSVRLRDSVIAQGALVTLGDVLENTGDAGARPIGPAPRPGATGTVLARVVERAAQAAGLNWTVPSGVTVITVRGAGATRTTPDGARMSAVTRGIKKGDLVTLSFSAPGVRVTARTRAQSDALPGEPVQLLNLQSNRTVDAVAIGPGRATSNFESLPTE